MSGDEVIQEVIEGILAPQKWPKPRVVKVFIASHATDLQEERRQLLESVGPDLQSEFDHMGLEVQLVDMHYGSDPDAPPDPWVDELQLQEIDNCWTVSRGCFFICLIGGVYESQPLPLRISTSNFELLTNRLENLGLDSSPLTALYEKTSDDSRTLVKKIEGAWAETATSAARLLKRATTQEGSTQLALSLVETQFDKAAAVSPNSKHHMIGVFRDWDDGSTSVKDTSLYDFRQKIIRHLSEENVIRLSATWNGEAIIDPDTHDEYLTTFRDEMYTRLHAMITKSCDEEPEPKARNKSVQEVYRESLTHLWIVERLLKSTTKNDDLIFGENLPQLESTLKRIKELIKDSWQLKARHGPILVLGGHGTGKSMLLAKIFDALPEWISGEATLYRIIRFAGTTPRSAYNLEMLRVLCQQLMLLQKLSDGALPQDASFDPLYISNWFQTLVRQMEANDQAAIILLIDDLHRLTPRDSDLVAALSWLPTCLPPNVHIVATTALPPESLKFTPVQKEKFRQSECLLQLPPPICTAAQQEAHLDEALNNMESHLGLSATSRLASMLTCAEFGLTETELLELLMPTTNAPPILELSNGHFSFSTFHQARVALGSLIHEKLMSGKLMICWRGELIRDVARKRYLPDNDALRTAHAEIANLFFSEFSETDSDQPPRADSPENSNEEPTKDTPFHSQLPVVDVTYSLRHVEESWLHLLKGGDVGRLKRLTFCNFDFLLAAVQTITVSYLRCVLEHVRWYLLDRDLELVYYTIRKSSDVLTRDPLQLGAQVVCWLRTVAEDSGDVVSHMLSSAMAWCDGFTAPLLVPLTAWLAPPLPLQIKTVLAPGGVRLMAPTPGGQHVVVVSTNGDPQLWHVMSNSLTHTFKGHSGPVLCLTVTRQSQYLLSGSEDLSICVWDLTALSLKLRIQEHIAPVLALTTAANHALVVSGGEDSSIIICSLATGQRITKIDHHRGPVTCVRVTATDDVLVSGSSDRTICLWSLDDFSLLNTISLPAAVFALEVSNDSVFLLAACEDNQLYLHSLATGTEIHCLKGHKDKVRCMCIAQDSCRAAVGTCDGKVLVYDMHSGRLDRTFTSHSAEVCGLQAVEKDDFLITAGGTRITYWSFRRETENLSQGIDLPLSNNFRGNTTGEGGHMQPLTCVDVSRDGTWAVTGGQDALVNVWQLNTHRLHATMQGHTAAVTCVAFAANGLFAVSGGEDKTARVWGLTLGLIVTVFRGHQAPVTAVTPMLDSRRVASLDRNGVLAVWLADNATLIYSVGGHAGSCMAVTNSMRYTITGCGGNSLRIWAASRTEEERFCVSHAEEICCFVVTADSQYVITGSKDTSLRVWQTSGGKLAQVLVGHTDHVTCVATSVADKTMAVSGSKDSNLIVWDLNTGADLHILKGHLGMVTCLRVSGDGTLAVSGSEDKTLITWDTKSGRILTSLQLHQPLLGVAMATDAARIAVLLLENRRLPIVCLHNTPAADVKLPAYVAPAEEPRPAAGKRPLRRLLKKEVSLDTYTWQKKYGHLTAGATLASVDERLKRRFSVSASMEEISKLPASNSATLGSQTLGPEQAALAQSQHFDQLEALWNRSPPRRKSPPRRRLASGKSRGLLRRESSETTEELSPCDELAALPGERT